LVTLSTIPLISFVPLFMVEEVGLSSNQVIWLETGVLLGGLASSYLWGWLSDRYGSKPVMVSGVYLLPLLPLAWLLMPRQTPWSLYIALAIAVGQGFANTGWLIGSGRLLFVKLVPISMKTAYMALYFAWAGIVGGLGQLLGGWLVTTAEAISSPRPALSVDPYSPLFVMGIVLPLIALLMFNHVKADSSVTTRQFAALFVRGNPFLAFESMVRYHRARDERTTVAMTERMGSTKSPLTSEDLIEALHDPRFLVRFEAIVSMARHGPDPKITDALIEALEGKEPSLSTMAAWGLGRIGGERAREALRRGLKAQYRSVQAHCARSLGTLGDKTVLPDLVERLAVEEDEGLQMAFGAALGQLGAAEATERLLALLRQSESKDARTEFALAVARLVGDEHRYVQLQRRTASEPGTALSQAISTLKTQLSRSQQSSLETEEALAHSAEALAQDDLSVGVALLYRALDILSRDQSGGVCDSVIQESVRGMKTFGPQRIEYVLLALHAQTCGLAK
jgi:HEAT repeat protein